MNTIPIKSIIEVDEEGGTMSRIVIENILIKELGDRPRTLRILLPNGYDEHLQRRYPALYMLDGQNLFDPSGYSGYSWDVARTLDRLQSEGETAGVIVVGIDNGGDHRIAEYSCAVSKRAGRRIARNFPSFQLEAEGSAFGDWIANTLKPSIDGRYRTLAEQGSTGIAGSSCGANIALSTALEHPAAFGVVGAFSPALWVVSPVIFRSLKTGGDTGVRVYHDRGGREEKSFFASTLLTLSSFRLHRALRHRLPADSVMRRFDPVARHTELFWQDRFPEFIRWAYGKKTHDEKGDIK